MIRRVLVMLGCCLSMMSFAGQSVSLNAIDVEQLTALDGIEASLARAIVALRTERGGKINSVEALRIVPGMTPAALQTLRANTTVSVAFTMDAKKTYSTVDDVLKQFSGEATIQQVQAWANGYAKTSPEMVQSWLRSSKGFAALPKFRVEYRRVNGWDQDFIYELADSNEPVPVKDDAGNDSEDRFLVRAEWDLSELVMSSDRIRIINEAQDVVKLRDKILTQVTRLYFERRRLQVEMLLNPREDLSGKVEDELRLLELTSGVDALTGGKMSRSLLPK